MRTRSAFLVGLVFTLGAFGTKPCFAQANGPGSAVNLNGTGAYVQFLPVSWFGITYTIEGWVYARSYNNWSRFFDFGNGANLQNIYCALSQDVSGYPIFGVINNTGDQGSVQSSQQLPLNQWCHLAVTFDSGTASMYMNGVLVGRGTVPLSYQGVRTNNYFGRSNWAGDGYANAIFDEIRFWGGALTQQQIRMNMHRSLSGAGLGYWRFDDGAGSIARDSTIFARHASLMSGANWVTSTAPISATVVTNVAWYRLGENDPGATDGLAANSSLDMVGSRTLKLAGGPVYDRSVAAQGSSLGVRFSSGTWGTNAVVSSVVDNFGLEVWVKPSVLTGDHMIVYNGHTGTSGWGLNLANGVFSVLFGGRQVIGSAPAQLDVWTHLALVCDSGITTLYTNGVAAATAPGTPAIPSGLFGVANAPNPPGAAVFQGTIDEVRVFTFGAGEFSTNDLLLKVSPPSVVATAATMLATNAATLNGLLNPGRFATLAWFEWGPFTPFGGRTPATNVPANGGLITISSSLTDLTPGLTYHYRLVASNALGITRSRDLEFWAPTLKVIGDNPLTFKHQLVDPGATAHAVAMVDAGARHNLFLKRNGAVLAWGDNTDGQTNVPPSATNIIAIAAGDYHNLALKADGTVVGWGYNGQGQTNIPPSATNVVAITAGGFHSLALKANGSVLGWGANANGQANIPTNATSVVAIAAGGQHSLALKADGTLLGWGMNNAGQITIPPAATNVVAIAAGTFHSLALKADGTVLAWGGNAFGESTVPPWATNAVAIAAGANHNLALKADGTIMGWGYGGAGQLDIPPEATNIVAIAAGESQSLGVKGDGTVLAWGFVLYTNVPTGLDMLDLPVFAQNNVNTSVTGTYQFNYRVTNTYGIVATASRTVLVRDPPTISSASATLVGTNAINGLRTVRLAALINPNGEPTTVSMNYGLSASYGGMSPIYALPGSSTAQTTTIDIELSPGFTWHWRVVADNGRTAFSPEQLFTVPTANIAGDANGDGIVDNSELTAAYAAYLPNSPWIAITNVAGPGQSSITFTLSNSNAGTYSVEVSDNLVEWQFLSPALPRYEFNHTNAPGGSPRYYRLRSP